MENRIPKVSIGMPVYNGEKYLEAAIKSMLDQDYEDFELIISDNASTDHTATLCQEFALNDSRIRYHRNETNIGATGNYNRVFQLARGEFFKWASHDDECHRSLIRRCLEAFGQSSPQTVLVFSKAELIDENGRVKEISPDCTASNDPRPLQRLTKILRFSSSAHPLWGLIRSDALRRTRLMGCIEADHILLAELALRGFLVEIPELLYRLRMHEQNALKINKSMKELLAWHDPAKRGKLLLLPYWERAYLEYLKGIQHARLPIMQRWLCFAAVPVHCYWRRLLRSSGPWRHRLGLHRRPEVVGA